MVLLISKLEAACRQANLGENLHALHHNMSGERECVCEENVLDGGACLIKLVTYARKKFEKIAQRYLRHFFFSLPTTVTELFR